MSDFVYTVRCITVLTLEFTFMLNAASYRLILVSQFNWNVTVTFIWSTLNLLGFLKVLFTFVPAKILELPVCKKFMLIKFMKVPANWSYKQHVFCRCSSAEPAWRSKSKHHCSNSGAECCLKLCHPGNPETSHHLEEEQCHSEQLRFGRYQCK